MEQSCKVTYLAVPFILRSTFAHPSLKVRWGRILNFELGTSCKLAPAEGNWGVKLAIG
ncbi:hypothetical protein HMPREF9075_00778 [Capnocytophaga sp. oral taxon 332 str. F0381]|nr:hypothetical protein HMPREF9075_00778 [Capnocytophaga sp. oral taxon 332 str. F0381]